VPVRLLYLLMARVFGWLVLLGRSHSTFSGAAVTRQYATGIRRINSVIACPEVRRARWASQLSGIIALTFTA
jgi:hypothetical protein